VFCVARKPLASGGATLKVPRQAPGPSPGACTLTCGREADQAEGCFEINTRVDMINFAEAAA
jgi:hypothetical protein